MGGGSSRDVPAERGKCITWDEPWSAAQADVSADVGVADGRRFCEASGLDARGAHHRDTALAEGREAGGSEGRR